MCFVMVLRAIWPGKKTFLFPRNLQLIKINVKVCVVRFVCVGSLSWYEWQSITSSYSRFPPSFMKSLLLIKFCMWVTHSRKTSCRPSLSLAAGALGGCPEALVGFSPARGGSQKTHYAGQTAVLPSICSVSSSMQKDRRKSRGRVCEWW